MHDVEFAKSGLLDSRDPLLERLLAEKGQVQHYSTDISDELWEYVAPKVAFYVRTRGGGLPQTPLRNMFNGILYGHKTGCQWGLLPKAFGPKSSVHAFYQALNKRGTMEDILTHIAKEYDKKDGYDYEWQSMDGTLVQAPARIPMVAEEGFGKNPTDRGRKGTKIHPQCDANGIPISVVVTGANVHDSKCPEKNLSNSFVNSSSEEEGSTTTNVCMDKAYDSKEMEAMLKKHGYNPHIRSRGEEIQEKTEFPPRRWVVERLMAWLKGFRSIRTRYTCKLRNFMGDVQLACMFIIWRRLATI